MKKSAGNVNLPTGTKTSLAIPASVQIARLASSRVIRVEISSGKPNFFQTESGIKLMLAPKSARALHLSSLKPHGIRNFPRSPSFSERFPAGRYGKMQARADGPFRVLKQINDNAYKIELSGHYNVSATFNVADFSPYEGDSDDGLQSGVPLFQDGEDDAGASHALKLLVK
nr:reverse transcriptase domain-containing protein [Tanacetum cinerariifolium]